MLRGALIWLGLATAVLLPLALAANSPLLAWRQAIYIVAGFAGIVAMALLLVQPLLASGALPGLPGMHGRRVHRWIGVVLVLAVVIHVAGLWITSPPDVIDALLFTSPTPFSAWGVIAMWACFAAAGVVAWRRRLRISPKLWRRLHGGLAAVIVVGSVIHALLIDGTMETVSKVALCALVLLASARVIATVFIRPR